VLKFAYSVDLPTSMVGVVALLLAWSSSLGEEVVLLSVLHCWHHMFIGNSCSHAWYVYGHWLGHSQRDIHWHTTNPCSHDECSLHTNMVENDVLAYMIGRYIFPESRDM